MPEPIIEIRGVAKAFKNKTVLKGVDLTVRKGEIYAFLGRNGAGKTTTIEMLLGLLDRDAGEIKVLGLDPRKQAIEIRRRVGYMAEDQTMYGWMKISEICAFLEPFYPTWNRNLVRQYEVQFELDPNQHIRNLSKGQNARLALLLALAHQPELVILDDPTLGLDPIMRKELMRDVIDHLQGAGVTVFFSSHLLYEIEPIADRVAILDHGVIVREEATEDLRADVKRFILSDSDFVSLPVYEGTLDIKRGEDRTAMTVEGQERFTDLLRERQVAYEQIDLNLDEIFEAYVIGRKEWESHVPIPSLERVA